MKYNAIALMLLCVGGFFACKKAETTIPPTLAQFITSSTTQRYVIPNNPNSVFKIPIGFTNVSNTNRTINYTVNSPTGAVAGTHYNILSTLGTATIPAGRTSDTIVVNGIYAAYSGARRDTLVFRITGGDGKPASWSNTYNLVLQR
jgi:hypothetical protein